MSAPASGRWHWGIGRACCRKRRSSTDRAISFLKPAILTTRFTIRPTRRWCTFCLKYCRRISMDRRALPSSITRSRSTRARRRVGPTTQPRECGGCGPAPPPLSGRHCESPSGGSVAPWPHTLLLAGAVCWVPVGSVAFALHPAAPGEFDLRSPLEVLVCGLGPTQ